ncbi:MAG: helix-turn-helix transcriptional regulator [Bacteroidales bacterium]|nr:helix-turn-helix transcriptional regulator [Bacteroidales bacterium]
MKAIEFLMKNQSDTASKWREDAEYRRRNSRWLLYSAMISLRVKTRMEEVGMTQVVLAEKLGCTQQHISMLLKGKNNMTLETIAKFEEALGFDIIGEALTPVDGYVQDTQSSRHTYLSESEQAPYGDKK